MIIKDIIESNLEVCEILQLFNEDDISIVESTKTNYRKLQISNSKSLDLNKHLFHHNHSINSKTEIGVQTVRPKSTFKQIVKSSTLYLIFSNQMFHVKTHVPALGRLFNSSQSITVNKKGSIEIENKGSQMIFVIILCQK